MMIILSIKLGTIGTTFVITSQLTSSNFSSSVKLIYYISIGSVFLALVTEGSIIGKFASHNIFITFLNHFFEEKLSLQKKVINYTNILPFTIIFHTYFNSR